jgi:hypothetical protein
MHKFNIRRPWQAGLIAATGLSLAGFYAQLLSQAGHTEWGFMLMFGAIWCLITLFWANDGFIEESGLLLAEAMDQNVENLHNRLVNLEEELLQLRSPSDGPAQPARLSRLPVAKDQLV